jgi:hypothetical protein
VDVFAHEPTRNNDDARKSKSADRDVETVDSRKTGRDQEVDRLREEGGSGEIGSCVDEHDGQSPLEICALEAIKVRSAFMLGVIFFPDDLDEVGKARLWVVVFAVDERHYFVGFLELVVVDEVDRGLGCHGESENQDKAYSPLDGEDVAEGLLRDVGDEGADYTEGDALHEDGEENKGGLDWSSEFEGCYLT